MNKTINATDMIELLKQEWEYAYGLIKDFGAEDERAQMHFGWCIGMKEMCECLIGIPIGLRDGGIVVTGHEAM